MSTTFNTLHDITKRQRMLFLGESVDGVFSPIAYSTNANLSFSADDIDISNQTDGNWSTSMQGKESAELSVDALVAYKDDLTNEVALQEGWNSEKLYFFLYAMVDVVQSEDGMTTTLKFNTSNVPFYMGRMKLSSLELTSDNGDVCKFSCSGNSEGTVSEYHDLLFSAEEKSDQDIILYFKRINGIEVGNAPVNVAQADLEEEANITIPSMLEEEWNAAFSDGEIEITTATVTFNPGDSISVEYSSDEVKYTVTGKYTNA